MVTIASHSRYLPMAGRIDIVIASGGLNILLPHHENIVIPHVTLIALAGLNICSSHSNPTSLAHKIKDFKQKTHPFCLKVELQVFSCSCKFQFDTFFLTLSSMQLFLIVITALLTSLSESKNSPSTQLRGSSSRDDNHEHRDNTQHGRSLQTKCGGGVKTTLFKGNITMQSLLRPLQCSAAALNNIGIVLDLVFDDVVKGNQALSAVTLNTTVCTTPIITAPTTGNYFNRQLATQLTAKYTYRAGKCTTMCWLVISEIAPHMSFCLR